MQYNMIVKFKIPITIINKILYTITLTYSNDDHFAPSCFYNLYILNQIELELLNEKCFVIMKTFRL